MGFDEWWENFWGPTKSFVGVNIKDIARTAWEEAQKQEQGPIGEIKELWAEHPSLRDEFAMSAMQAMAGGEGYNNQDWPRNVVCDAYKVADAMLKERQK